MSVLINLLPQVHQSRVKDQNQRRLATTASLVVLIFSAVTLLGLFIFTQAQSWTLGRLQKDINERQAQLESTPNISEMLTTQANLAALPGLYSSRVHMTQLFNVLSSLAPIDIRLSVLDVQNGGVSLTGRASNFSTVAKLVKALEASNIELGSGASKANAPHFTDVTLVSITPGAEGAAFNITAKMSGEVTSASN